MHGRISYDGRQTNDQCSTKPLFIDTPVEAEIIRVGKDYRISFSVNCLKGSSPRVMSWTLICDESGTCSQPIVQPWGKGAITLTTQK
jgi:hypothetical protein